MLKKMAVVLITLVFVSGVFAAPVAASRGYRVIHSRYKNHKIRHPRRHPKPHRRHVKKYRAHHRMAPRPKPLKKI